MTSENTFFNRGVEIGSAPQQGLDAATLRDATAQKNADAHDEAVQITRNKTQVNDQNEYSTKRQRGWDADNDATAAATPKASSAVLRARAAAAGGPTGAPAPAAGGMAPPTGATPADGTAPATGMAPAGAPAAPAPEPTLSEGDALRRQQTQLLQQGKYEQAAVLKGRAEAADMKDSFEKGASMAEQPGVFDAAAQLITQKDKSLSFSTDAHGRQLLTIVQPNGQATSVAMDPAKRKLILGAQQMMEDGYVEAALGKFAAVSSDLAAEVASRNKQVEMVAKDNNNVKHQEQDDDAKTVAANAAMVSAQAHKTTADTAKSKESYGNPVQMVGKDGEAVLMQPVRQGGKVSFEKVELPDGARFPKQAADRKFNEKSGVFTDAQTGKALSRLDADTGMILPVGEKDIFAGKNGEKKQAEWEDQGVTRGVVEDGSGTAHFAWVSKDDTTGSKYSSPQEALAAGKKAAQAALPKPSAAAPRAPVDTSPTPPRQSGLDFVRGRMASGRPLIDLDDAPGAAGEAAARAAKQPIPVNR